jgi:GNAT superfamily N-acetyltransferase
MNFKIRKVEIEDMSEVLNLIKALAVFEKEPDAVEINESYLAEKGFGSNPAFQCFVAEMNQAIEGIALVYMRFSTWKGEVLHLEDLIVNREMRGKGLGEALLNEVVKYGGQLGVKRISWEVLDWNTPAINFYEKKGAIVMRDWNVVQLDEKGIKNYLSKL